MDQEKVSDLQNPCWRSAQIPPAAGGGEFLVAPSAVPAPSSRSQPDSRALAAPLHSSPWNHRIAWGRKKGINPLSILACAELKLKAE